MRPAEIVQYRSFDGAMIEAQLVKPANYQPGAKLPLVVLVHGGPTGAWSQRFHSWTQLLATRGYLVLCPNIRGSTGYRGTADGRYSGRAAGTIRVAA